MFWSVIVLKMKLNTNTATNNATDGYSHATHINQPHELDDSLRKVGGCVAQWDKVSVVTGLSPGLQLLLFTSTTTVEPFISDPSGIGPRSETQKF